VSGLLRMLLLLAGYHSQLGKLGVTGIVTELCRGFSQCSFVSVGIYVKIVHDNFIPHSVQRLITGRRRVV